MTPLTPDQELAVRNIIKDQISSVGSLTKDQREEIDSIISVRNQGLGLTLSQKWDVVVILTTIMGFASAVLGIAGYFAVVNAARSTAAQVSARDAAGILATQAEFLKAVQNGASHMPQGSVVAFSLPSGCPNGWNVFSNAAGRTIVGAGEGPGLSKRGYLEQGGKEEHILTIDQMPAHQHGVYPHAGYIVGVSGTAPGAGADDPIPTSRVSTGLTTFVGGGNGFPTVSPFIALHYCVKQ